MNNNNEAATLVIYLCVTLWKDSGRLTLWRLGISTSHYYYYYYCVKYRIKIRKKHSKNYILEK